MRVLLLTQNLDVWGAQRQVVELARGLDAGRFDVRLGALESGGALHAEVAALGVPVERFERRWRWDLSPVRRLAHYLRDESIDVVHSFLFLPNFYARFAGRLAGTAVVSSLRSTGIEGWPRYAADVATCALCDALIANSEAGRDHYVRRGGLARRMVVVRNALPRRTPLPGDASARACAAWGLDRFTRRIGMVAAMEWRKDQRLLVEALPLVLRAAPDTGLVLAGDGSRLEQMRALVWRMGLERSVVFLGKIGNPDALYPLLDVYVQASYRGEGTSNAILEAMGHGRPVVATDIGGNAEIVLDGVTGRIVPAGNREALAEAVGALLLDPELRVAMGRAAAERARTAFSPEAMVEATERIYAAVRRGARRQPEGAAAAC
jgi:glycosyltransferase involved in cell wall biosynthesis